MSDILRVTFLTEGSSDRALLPLLDWLLAQHSTTAFNLRWADLRGLPTPPKTLAEKVRTAVDLYPCELLLVHRDADREPPSKRVDEIRRASISTADGHDTIPVVPVRMQEAWLLHDNQAIRTAAGRPRGTHPIGIPKLSTFESLADPKETLITALKKASNTSGRRARRFRPYQLVHRVAELIDDWTPLRQLPAFQRLEAEICRCLAGLTE